MVKPNLEDDLKRLEEIVDSLENGKMTLEESLALYNEGVTLTARCREQLETAEQQVLMGKKALFPEEKD